MSAGQPVTNSSTAFECINCGNKIAQLPCHVCGGIWCRATATIETPAKLTTVGWRLLVFDQATEGLVTEVMLTHDQAVKLRPYLGIVDTDDHFGSYPVAGLSWFAEEHVEDHD